MSKEIFIRLDAVGEWRGTEHRSSMQGLGDEVEYYQEQGADVYFEDGVSCYTLSPMGIVELYKYWKYVACITEQNAQNMQVTIFEGDFVGFGTEGETLANCTKTLAELPAIGLYKKWAEIAYRFWEDDETECEDVLEYFEEHAIEIMTLFDKIH